MAEPLPDAYEQARRTVVTLLPAIDGLEAEGFLSDLHDVVAEIPGVGEVAVVKRSDAARRFEVSCRFSGPSRALAGALERAWADQLAYGPHEAHLLATTRDTVTMDFITWLEGRWSVTGRITARRVARRRASRRNRPKEPRPGR